MDTVEAKTNMKALEEANNLVVSLQEAYALADADVERRAKESTSVLRERHARALSAIALFLDQYGEPGRIASRQVVALQEALLSLNRGSALPIVRPVRRTGRLPDDEEVWRGRAFVALAIECLKLSGMTLEQALSSIPRNRWKKLNDLARTDNSKEKTNTRDARSNARQWHAKFVAHDRNLPQDVLDLFNGLLVEIGDPGSAVFREKAELLLVEAEKTAAQIKVRGPA
jgi:hypothetical protein